MKGQETLFSHKSNDWSTPKDFYETLDYKYHFDLDPCPLNYTIDALTIPWEGRAFVNPPYDRIQAFLDKGMEEIEKGNAKILVFLVPARTDTKWFHQHLYNKPGVEITFIKGRLVFGSEEYWNWVWGQEFIQGKKNKLYQKFGKKNPAPFPSMLVVIRPVC